MAGKSKIKGNDIFLSGGEFWEEVEGNRRIILRSRYYVSKLIKIKEEGFLLKRSVLLVMVAFIFAVIPAFADSVATTGEKQSIDRTEILRGQAEATTSFMNPSYYPKMVEKAINENKARKIDTDGFYLGVYFEAWRNMMRVVEDNNDFYSEDFLEPVIETADQYFEGFRSIQQQYELDDQTLCEIVGTNLKSFQRYIKAWEKRMKK
jgi:hypothetical protein